MTVDRRSLTHTLRDGRILGYAEYGDAAGSPVVYFHGTPGSRLDLGLPGMDEELAARGLRGLAIDRPGIGLSTFRPRRRIPEWPSDVAELADGLGLERFSLLGVSGGAPYTLAAAARLGTRVAGVGVVAGVAPWGAPGWDGMPARNRRLFGLARRLPAMLRPVVRRLGRAIATQPERSLDQLLVRVAPIDRETLARPAVREAMLGSWHQAFRQGPDGVWWELVLESRAWGFDLGEVRLPVLLWFGGADLTVPAAMGYHLAAVLPRSEARHYPEEGHLSIVLNRRGEILDRMAAVSRQGT